MSEYENYALMLQHSVQAIQHAHSFSMQAFETMEKLVDTKREVSALKRKNKVVLIKMKKLEDQAEAATKAQQMAEEKAESAEAIKKAEAIPLPFLPPAPPSSQAEDESESEAEDEDNNEDEALVRKSKDATEAKSLPPTEQVMDLTLDEEGDEVGEAPREAVTGQLSSDLLLAERSLDKTLAEIDAELATEKAAEVVPQESAEVQTKIAPKTKES
ncbi:uncharacterized protein LOC114318773 [Camellia sinensis]|uniref:uncharacterized protein LOC114318773 n=1 Tax=Camellia sinensis TaxID=4442 RepID=UPI0010364BD4|nr:uncharacterized protein LOC114318773 [Camellia sinensis]